MSIRPRRSLLYMPGANARALEKARTLPCDGVILDLEDAVAPEAKAMARQQVMAAVSARGFGGREVIVRINGLDTSWGSTISAPQRRRIPTASWCRKFPTPAICWRLPSGCWISPPITTSAYGR